MPAAPPVVAALLALVAVGAALATFSDQHPRRRPLHYVAKPLTTLLILLLAAIAPADLPHRPRALVLLALLLSALGDVFLMLPEDRFVPGLAAFALAQLCYCIAWAGALSAPPAATALLPWLLYAGLLVLALWRGAGPLRLPVLAYALLLAAMGGLATARWLQLGGPPALLGMLGAAAFILSDSLLAWDRFRAPLPRVGLWVLASYYLAQSLIALAA
ncbi:MAG: lysoplasmalogenase [Anaerolineae bacterium]|jgi:uncharacterized membrane protein YhhN|nr:lysoplasmalogenase [Chloroflexota bacterium]